MQRQYAGPGYTYASKSILSFPASPLWAGARRSPFTSRKRPTVSKSNTSSALSAGDIANRVRASGKGRPYQGQRVEQVDGSVCRGFELRRSPRAT